MLNNGFELDGTQNMLFTISLIHYVFDGITDRAELATAIASTAKTTKGFWEYSQHTHEIKKCSRNWAKWIINNPKYYPYDSGKAIATAKSKEPKTSRFDEVKQGLIDLLAEIGDRTFRTVTLALEYIRKRLHTSPTTLYEIKELWQHLGDSCNVSPSKKYSDFGLENSETCEKVEIAEIVIESDITVTAPNELLGAESYPQKIIDPVISGIPAAPIFCEKTLKPIQANDFQPIMTPDQQLAIARTCPSPPMPESANRRSPKEPPRPNLSTLENIQAIVTAEPSKSGSQLAMLQAKLLIPWLKSEERSQTETAIVWLKKLLDGDRKNLIATDEHLQT